MTPRRDRHHPSTPSSPRRRHHTCRIVDLSQRAAIPVRSRPYIALSGPFQNSVAEVRRPRYLLALFGAVGFVLLIACANLASLQLLRRSGSPRFPGVVTMHPRE